MQQLICAKFAYDFEMSTRKVLRVLGKESPTCDGVLLSSKSCWQRLWQDSCYQGHGTAVYKLGANVSEASVAFVDHHCMMMMLCGVR